MFNFLKKHKIFKYDVIVLKYFIDKIFNDTIIKIKLHNGDIIMLIIYEFNVKLYDKKYMSMLKYNAIIVLYDLNNMYNQKGYYNEAIKFNDQTLFSLFIDKYDTINNIIKIFTEKKIKKIDF